MQYYLDDFFFTLLDITIIWTNYAVSTWLCCKADSSILIMHSSVTSISVLKNSCKYFSTYMRLWLLFSLDFFLLYVKMCFRYFSNLQFDATNFWREIECDGFKHSAKSCKILSQKNIILFFSTSSLILTVLTHLSQHSHAINKICLSEFELKLIYESF